MIVGKGTFTLTGHSVNIRRHLRVKADSGVFYASKSSAKLYLLKGIEHASAGAFILTGTNVNLKVIRKISPVPGKFMLLGGYISLIKPNQPSYLIDDLAKAAIPAQDFFVPVMRWPKTDTVLSLNDAFGLESGYIYSIIFNDYYDQDTNVWNDALYGEDYPGQTIPVSLKADVADQLYNYNTYLILNTEWRAEYEMEFIFQWPYYYATQVLARKNPA